MKIQLWDNRCNIVNLEIMLKVTFFCRKYNKGGGTLVQEIAPEREEYSPQAEGAWRLKLEVMVTALDKE
ncbi:hypothetical protein B9K06_24725 [Bacillus sp. OG2]|nr:hypothetical protein B9K06_24725 [Bacillus sp. OG2]